MPSSAVRTFTDPDDYALSFREAQVELTIAARGEFAAKIARIDLHRVRMQRFSDNLPRIAHSALETGSAMFSWLTRPGPRQLSSGVEMQSTSIMRHNEGRTNHLHSSGLASFGSMSLPVKEMAAVGEAMRLPCLLKRLPLTALSDRFFDARYTYTQHNPVLNG